MPRIRGRAWITAESTLLRAADEAVLVAKTQGRNRVVVGPVVGELFEEAVTGDGDAADR